MDEVDAIILQSLREIGCEIEDDDVKLKSLTSEEIFKCLRNLCKCIKPEIDIPSHLPAQMAQRFSAASQLVDCCKSIGFNGDLGYQTILYSNVIELRRIFMWLIEHLPKAEDKTDFHSSRDLSKSKTLENAIATKLAADMRKPWILEFLQPHPNKPVNPAELELPSEDQISPEYLEYYRKYLVPIFRQASSGNLLASILLTHDREIAGGISIPTDTMQISQSLRNTIRSTQSSHLISSSSKSNASAATLSNENNEEVEDESQVVPSKPKTKLELLNDRIEQFKSRIEDQEDIYRQLTNDKSDQLKSIDDEKQKLIQLQKDKKLKDQMAILLENPEESVVKLKQSLEAIKNKRKNLIAKFESHKAPLDEKLESFNGVNSTKIQKVEEKMNEVKKIRVNICEIQEDLQNKTKMLQRLSEELNQMKRVTERSAYTSRIMDIIKNIKRQNKDIDDVLKDTKTIQKSINSVEGQLQRQFIVTEDLIWNNTSKKDEYSKKAYKLLISMHTEFSELVNLIESTGSVQREIRELEDQIDQERQQNVTQKLEQITKDLKMLSEC